MSSIERESLAALYAQGGRHRFTATLVRYAIPESGADSALIESVRDGDDRAPVADHLWVAAQPIRDAGIGVGERFGFVAEVRRDDRPDGPAGYGISEGIQID